HVMTGVIARENAASLEAHGSAAVEKQLLLEHVRGVCEGSIDVAVAQRKRCSDVVDEIAVGTRRIGTDGSLPVTDRCEGLEVDPDSCGGILGRAAAFGYCHRDCLADVTDLAAGE